MKQKKIIDGEVVKRVMPEQAIMDAVLRISQLKRHVDLLAHYDAYDFALLLPNTKAQGASVFVNRFVKVVTERPLAGGIDAAHLHLACGISSVPEDFKELSALLGAADLAMHQAREANVPVVLYRDIKNHVTVNANHNAQNPVTK
jgi:diguanylate cyclase (GGDEF)-like protein